MLYAVTLAYDGTDFEGWQAQGTGGAPARARTVQAVVEEALARLCAGGRVVVAGAGRTDAGVHAVGQVASFDLPREMAPGELARAMNALMPPDVRVVAAAPAPPGFHARKSASSKLYRYVLDTVPVQLPTRRRVAGHVPFALDRERVAAAALLLAGRQDFASLASSGGSARTTVRTVMRSEARWEEATLVYEVEADGFLRKMVRSMVGALVEAGRGAMDAEDLSRALAARDRRAWPAPAQARGLTLVAVRYPPP